VIAIKEGESSKVIVVGAHYDGVDDGCAADDNASGVAVLLETAGLVHEQDVPYTIYFVAFGAEEAGLLGSYAFLSSLDNAERDNIILMVNLDSISVGDNTYAYSLENASVARDWAMNWADSRGYALETIWDVNLQDEEGYATADYAAFDEAGIPWLYFEATNWTLGDEDGYTQVNPQYGEKGVIIHTEYDDLEYFDEIFPGRVDDHLNLYVNVLNALLVSFENP
jgi:Zn-dependent M28 family amino/carboxypeptidase